MARQKKNFPVHDLGPDELNEYAMENIPDDLIYLVYWYENGGYDGSGVAVWKAPNGKFGWENLSHCSCYGPCDGIDGEGGFELKSILIDLDRSTDNCCPYFQDVKRKLMELEGKSVKE